MGDSGRLGETAMMSTGLHERLHERLTQDVCRNCLYRTAGAGCGLPDGLECPILTRIEPIVNIVRTTHSDRVDPYVDQLREVVCANCRMEDESGHCRMRDHADCALDDYFALIVDVVEDELERGP
jgi:hypothetical protein